MKISKRGFTIVEVLVSITIIAILASVTIAYIVTAKRGANETTAATFLRQIALMQTEVKVKGLVDQDGDTIGEYALLAELCGTVNVRSYNAKDRALSEVYAPKSGLKYGEKDGYYFQVYLPSISELPVTDNGITTPTVVSSDADLQEGKYRCYAWPMRAGSTGNKAFVIDQSGNIFYTENLKDGKAVYNGSKAPAYNAASPTSDDTDFSADIVSGTGNDGLKWQILSSK